MVRIQLHSLLCKHVLWCLLLVSECLSAINLLHLCRVAVLWCQNENRRVSKFVRDLNSFNTTAKVLLHPISKRLVHFFELVKFSLFRLSVIKDVNIIFCDRLDFPLFVLGQVLRCEFVNRIRHQQNFVTTLCVLLQDRRLFNLWKTIPRQVQNGVLVFLHTCYVVVQTCQFIFLIRCVEP